MPITKPIIAGCFNASLQISLSLVKESENLPQLNEPNFSVSSKSPTLISTSFNTPTAMQAMSKPKTITVPSFLTSSQPKGATTKDASGNWLDSFGNIVQPGGGYAS